MRPPGTVTAADSVLPSTIRALTSSSAISATATPMPIFQPLPMPVVTLAVVSEKFVIQGGVPLSGELTVAGNKNAALPILAACLLTEEELLLHRVPRIRDTEAQIALLEQLGVEVAWVGRQQRPPLRPRRHRDNGRRGALEPDPRLLPARRAAAGALRRGADAAARAATSSAAAASTPTSTPSRTSAPASTATAGSS